MCTQLGAGSPGWLAVRRPTGRLTSCHDSTPPSLFSADALIIAAENLLLLFDYQHHQHSTTVSVTVRRLSLQSFLCL